MPTRAKAIQSKPTLSLSVQYASNGELPTRAQFRRWIGAALERPASITLRVVDAEESHALNTQFRRRAYATNVLTFVYDVPQPGHEVAADIVLCAPVVRREAREQCKSALAHFAHLTVHGALHAQGYDHESDRDAEIMEQREIATLDRLGFADPYTTSSRRKRPAASASQRRRSVTI